MAIAVNQLAACTVVQEVAGSIPAGGTYFRRMHCDGHLSMTMPPIDVRGETRSKPPNVNVYITIHINKKEEEL